MNPETLQYLESKLGRPPTAVQLSNGTYLAEFFSFSAPASQFVGATEGEALERLATYLRCRVSEPVPPVDMEGNSDEHNR